MMKTARVVLFCCVALPLAAQAPTPDTSGDYMLSGTAGTTYYFRHVYYVVDTSANSNGDVSGAVASYGNITFHVDGTYTISNGFVSDYGNNVAADPLSCYLARTICAATAGTTVTGSYSISASGFGFLSDPLTGDNVYGLVAANGIFSGSSTEVDHTACVASNSCYNDLFIGAPVPSTQPAFNGSYTAAGYLGLPGFGEDMAFQINPNGAGSLGTVAINGYLYEAGVGVGSASQSSNVTYTFSNGAAILKFPTSTTANFFSGQEYLYFSPDGQFFFGGSPTGFDMIVGVSAASGTQNFGTCISGSSCLYYQAGIDQDVSQISSSGYVYFDGYYGSFNALSGGDIFAHERISDIIDQVTYGQSYADSFTPPVTGSYTDSPTYFQYWVSDGGAVRIGQGIGPYLGLTVAFQAPTFTPTGPVYIDPTHIVNAASNSPFTAGIADGEMISIYGTNLAPPGTVLASSYPIPTTQGLNGVQVIINGVAAPVDGVTPGQINVIVPSATSNPLSLANIQVINNGVSSNVVTVTVNQTVAGVYTPDYGLGYAFAADTTSGQILNASTPAQPGDAITVYATGLGDVYNPVPDGAEPPNSPLSPTKNTITADVGGVPATVVFAGLAPGYASLYQINLQIPSTMTSGVYTMDISGPDSYATQALIAIGTGASDRPAVRSARRHHARAASSVVHSVVQRRGGLCLFNTRPACTVAK